jgi:hypothetical protein
VNASIRPLVPASLAPLSFSLVLAIALAGAGCSARTGETAGAWHPRAFGNDRFVAENPPSTTFDVAPTGARARPSEDAEHVARWWARERWTESAPIVHPSPRPLQR